MSRYIGLILLIVMLNSCSYNGSFYYTKSEYRAIENIDYQDLFLENTDGIKLHAVYLEPKGKSKGTVLLIHGNGGNVSGWIHSIEPLTNAGYRTLVFDYQGYGKSEGKPTHKNVVSDTELFLNYLISKKDKTEKMIIWGVSLGGNLSVNIASRNPDKVDVLIDEAGFSSHSDIAADMMPWLIRPLVRITVASPYRSKNLISELKIPVLIIHSLEDKVVPFEMGQKVYNNANQPKEFWEIKGQHCHAIRDYETQFIQKLDSIVSEKKENAPLFKALRISGIIKKQGVTTYQYGSHTIQANKKYYALRSNDIDLDKFIGENVMITYIPIAGYPVDGGPKYLKVLRIKIIE